jgi:hypothetical protein
MSMCYSWYRCLIVQQGEATLIPVHRVAPVVELVVVPCIPAAAAAAAAVRTV